MNTNKKGKRKNPPQNNSKKRKPTANNAEKETDRKENKMCNILERKGTNLSLLATIVGLFSTLCVFIRLVYDVIYKINCGNFYGIPEKYFSTNIDKNIIYRLSAIVLVITYFVPRIMEKYYLKHNGDDKANTMYSIFLSVIIGIIMSAFLIYNLYIISYYGEDQLFQKIRSFSLKYINIISLPILVMSIAAIILITLPNIINKRKKKSRIWYYVIVVVEVIVLAANIIIIGYGTWTRFKSDLNIENKTKYEFAKYECDEYVVLSEYNDKVLLVPFQVDEDGRYIFNTGEYIFKELDSGIFEYRVLGCPPDIEK